MELNLFLESSGSETKDGKHLVFLLGGNGYGIPILDVSEINGLMDITPIPKTPLYIKGVINLRGKVIPVMDLRLRFGMAEKEYDTETCIYQRITANKLELSLTLYQKFLIYLYQILSHLRIMVM